MVSALVLMTKLYQKSYIIVYNNIRTAYSNFIKPKYITVNYDTNTIHVNFKRCRLQFWNCLWFGLSHYVCLTIDRARTVNERTTHTH